MFLKFGACMIIWLMGLFDFVYSSMLVFGFWGWSFDFGAFHFEGVELFQVPFVLFLTLNCFPCL